MKTKWWFQPHQVVLFTTQSKVCGCMLQRPGPRKLFTHSGKSRRLVCTLRAQRSCTAHWCGQWWEVCRGKPGHLGHQPGGLEKHEFGDDRCDLLYSSFKLFTSLSLFIWKMKATPPASLDSCENWAYQVPSQHLAWERCSGNGSLRVWFCVPSHIYEIVRPQGF